MLKCKALSLTLGMIFLIVLFTSCGEKASSSQQAKQTNVTSATIFKFYNKVKIEQTKEEVNAELGVTGTEETQVKNSFSYVDKQTGYGVSIVFNDTNKVSAKTLIYPERKDIAFLCGKTYTQAQSDKIKKGTTYEQVKSTLGGGGIEINTTQIPFDDNKLSYIRIWVNKDGSMIQVVFGTDGTSNNAMFFNS